MKIEKFTKTQVNLFKGIGILLIVLHNYFHNIPPTLGENEFRFNPRLISKYTSHIMDMPEDFARLFFSIWGHYGVEIFIFFSAYGLAISYSKNKPRYNEFILKRFYKLYITFLICIVFYLSLAFLKTAIGKEEVILWDSLLWKVLLISNFIPDQSLKPVGPWWFIPFIFQLYFLFPIIYKLKNKRHGLLALASIGLISEWYLYDTFESINYTIIGHLPIICLGIYLADKKDIIIKPSLIFVIFAVFMLGHINFYLWTISDVAVIYLFIIGFNITINKMTNDNIFIKTISFYGNISLHLFLVNGFLRSPFHDIAVSVNTWWGTIITAIASLIFSTIIAIILQRIDTKTRSIYSHFKN